MSVRDYLKQLEMLDIKINQRMMEKNDLEFIASKYPKNRKHCMELAAGIDEVIRDLVNQKDLIIGQIMQLKDHRYTDLLFLHYARFMILEDVADSMQKNNGKTYSYDHIRALHSEALKELQKRI